MKATPQILLAFVAVLGASVAALPSAANNEKDATSQSAEASKPILQDSSMQHHAYVGMWVTADGHIRQELLPNGRYDEARGNRQSAYQGRYEIRDNRIHYWDDSGFTADGTFVSDDELHHGGMIFYRRK
ncbi:Atu4866 domain-containing protein [Burkholderia vietnamiensis]|uniref:Atu4866 domain-containing protein n=1 Tax=Burkholderia vietnamiensis TaxID=60552 RepID=UPI001593A1FD|nr:Atu4866 domain-containing protein [Burkholderia vietnamiensis]